MLLRWATGCPLLAILSVFSASKITATSTIKRNIIDAMLDTLGLIVTSRQRSEQRSAVGLADRATFFGMLSGANFPGFVFIGTKEVVGWTDAIVGPLKVWN